MLIVSRVVKHFHTTITDTAFTYHRDQARIDAEAALDGIYVLRTSVDTEALDPAAVVEGYKNLANVERDFRIIKRPRGLQVGGDLHLPGDGEQLVLAVQQRQLAAVARRELPYRQRRGLI